MQVFIPISVCILLLYLLRNKINVNMVIIYIGILLGGYYLYWAYKLQFNVNPDELMRYLLPKYIYEYNSLPSGYDKEAIYHLGNWSYAFYPQWLGSILSAFFMKVIAIFSTSTRALIVGARLTSVLFGVMASVFIGLSLKKLTNSKLMVMLGMLFTGFLPQITYLSSYVNNDIIAVAGVTVIFYAMILASKDNWNIKSSVLLAGGFIICLLGYMNSYGFVLIGGLYFLYSIFKQVKQGKLPRKTAFLLFALIFCLVLICILPFLIRNYVLYNGDFLGMATFKKEYQNWLANGGRVLQYPYGVTHKNITMLFFDNEFWILTWHSFIGLFGYFTVDLKPIYYTYYLLIIFSGVIGLLINKHKNIKFLSPILKIMIGLGCIITIALFIYYAIKIDSQPQGRYIMTIAPLLMFGVTLGIDSLMKNISKYYRRWLAIVAITYVFINCIILLCYVQPNLM